MREIGLDIHREFCEVAIAEQGEIRSPGRIETTPEVLELLAQSLGAAAVDLPPSRATSGSRPARRR